MRNNLSKIVDILFEKYQIKNELITTILMIWSSANTIVIYLFFIFTYK